MFKNKFYLQSFPIILIALTIFLNGCGVFSPKTTSKIPPLLKTENAAQSELLEKINHLAQVNSMRAKMYLKFEDNSFAELGIAEKYKSADGTVVVQRPANIFLEVQVPVIKSDVAKMTSDGERFRVAILLDVEGGKYKKFIIGSNNANYSKLQEAVSQMDLGGKDVKQNVNAFANLRPQHFTDGRRTHICSKRNFPG
jgi:hypothetical protein